MTVRTYYHPRESLVTVVRRNKQLLRRGYGTIAIQCGK
jgi:hypothetical protein